MRIFSPRIFQPKKFKNKIMMPFSLIFKIDPEKNTKIPFITFLKLYFKIAKTPIFRSGLLYKIWPVNYFFKRRDWYQFKPWEFRNLRAFEFFNYWIKLLLRGAWKFGFIIDISWRCLKTLNCLIGNSDNLVIFKIRNSNV